MNAVCKDTRKIAQKAISSPPCYNTFYKMLSAHFVILSEGLNKSFHLSCCLRSWLNLNLLSAGSAFIFPLGNLFLGSIPMIASFLLKEDAGNEKKSRENSRDTPEKKEG